jgi:rRNA maturation endonuclease Nob1
MSRKEVLIESILETAKKVHEYIRVCSRCEHLFRTKGKSSRICWNCIDKAHRGYTKYNERI